MQIDRATPCYGNNRQAGILFFLPVLEIIYNSSKKNTIHAFVRQQTRDGAVDLASDNVLIGVDIKPKLDNLGGLLNGVLR